MACVRQGRHRQSDAAKRGIKGGNSSHQHPSPFGVEPGPHVNATPHAEQTFFRVVKTEVVRAISVLA
jgi:hypothetical protein